MNKNIEKIFKNLEVFCKEKDYKLKKSEDIGESLDKRYGFFYFTKKEWKTTEICFEFQSENNKDLYYGICRDCKQNAWDEEMKNMEFSNNYIWKCGKYFELVFDWNNLEDDDINCITCRIKKDVENLSKKIDEIYQKKNE